MDMTITVGWWALPMLVTLATFGYALAIPGEPMRGDYSFPDLMPLVPSSYRLWPGWSTP